MNWKLITCVYSRTRDTRAILTLDASYLQHAFHAESILEGFIRTRVADDGFFFQVSPANTRCSRTSPLSNEAALPPSGDFWMQKSLHGFDDEPRRPRRITHVSRATESGTLDKYALYLHVTARRALSRVGNERGT